MALRDAFIRASKKDVDANALLVQVKTSRYRALKAKVAEVFIGSGVPAKYRPRHDVVVAADRRISSLASQGGWAYDQAMSRLDHAWESDSSFKLAVDALR